MSSAESHKSGTQNHSWYASTANRHITTLGILQGEINCDVCVIGGGFTGLSAALDLRARGYSVSVIEANAVASMASGRNGGHILRGYSKSPSALAAQLGPDDAKKICRFTMDAIDTIVDRIKKHNIDCDLRFGHVTAGLNAQHANALKSDIDEWAELGYADMLFLDEKETQQRVRSKGYTSSLYDPRGGQFHPLNYGLGLAQTLINAGAHVYEGTPALEVIPGPIARVITAQGAVTARFVILAGDVKIKGAETVNRKLISGTAHMIATEPLGARADELIPHDDAVMDANFLMNYYRLSADKRILFGGTCNYSGIDYPGQKLLLKKRMIDVFPSLTDVKLDYFWGGTLDFTMNRLPHVGRIGANVFYVHGFSGHGIVLSNMMGKLIAAAIDGTATEFDIFTKIKHLPFMGGDVLKRPLFVAGMLWYRLRDYLSNL